MREICAEDANSDGGGDIGGKLAVNKIRKLPEGTTDDVPRTGSGKTQAKRENKKRYETLENERGKPYIGNDDR